MTMNVYGTILTKRQGASTRTDGVIGHGLRQEPLPQKRLSMEIKMLLQKKSSPAPDSATNPGVRAIQSRLEGILRVTDLLFDFLRAFVLDLKELDPQKFRHQLDQLNSLIGSDENIRKIELGFERDRDSISQYIELQKRCVAEREKELKDIIELLVKAMTNLNTENREFYQRVHAQSEKIEKISNLDDIKRIKRALRYEVEQIREIVDLKADQDKRSIDILAQQVEQLRTELEKARAKSMTDPLTGVYNRQALDQYLDERISRASTADRNFALLMLDIDDFKKINDNYGHLIGDRALMAFAGKCRQAIRSDDFLARYGGEEFVIILEGATFRNAMKKAKQICETVAAAKYTTDREQKGEYLSITTSIGVTVFRKNDTPQTLLERADKALYTAKQKGKNRAVGRRS